MESIFNRKLLFIRKKRINFDFSFFEKIKKIIMEDLQDYIFIFEKSPKKILLLNNLTENDNNFFLNCNLSELNFEEDDLMNIKNISNFEKQDLIIGINSLHNVNYLNDYLKSIINCLNDGGIFCGNFFGNKNLSELKKLIIQNDAKFSKNIYQRFNPVISAESVVNILQNTGFKNIVISAERIDYHFNSFNNAMLFLKNINERNYFSQMQKTSPNKKLFEFNEKITLDFDLIKVYCTKQ